MRSMTTRVPRGTNGAERGRDGLFVEVLGGGFDTCDADSRDADAGH